MITAKVDENGVFCVDHTGNGKFVKQECSFHKGEFCRNSCPFFDGPFYIEKYSNKRDSYYQLCHNNKRWFENVIIPDDAYGYRLHSREFWVYSDNMGKPVEEKKSIIIKHYYDGKRIETDNNGNTTTYNDKGKVLSRTVTDENGNTTTYNHRGKVVSRTVTDEKRNTTTYKQKSKVV